MKFIEMTGQTLQAIVSEEELGAHDLQRAGVTDESIVRVNQQGDIEVRRKDRWDVIGGLLGDFAQRTTQRTGMDWA